MMKNNSWQIILTDGVIKKFKKLPKQDTQRIFNYKVIDIIRAAKSIKYNICDRSQLP